MNRRTALGASLAMTLLVGGVLVAADLKSGPQIGGTPTPFNPLHATGPNEGKKLCLV
jgi:hypothetical protein